MAAIGLMLMNVPSQNDGPALVIGDALDLCELAEEPFVIQYLLVGKDDLAACGGVVAGARW